MFGFNPTVHHRHRALASAAAVGPPEAPDRYVPKFNGEIYNYLSCVTSCAPSTALCSPPTATVGDPRLSPLGHRGAAAAPRMFAFALWDTVTR